MTQPCQPYDHTPCIAKVLINFINFCSLKLSAIMIFAAVFSCFLTLILSPWDYIISEVSCFLSSPPPPFFFLYPSFTSFVYFISHILSNSSSIIAHQWFIFSLLHIQFRNFYVSSLRFPFCLSFSFFPLPHPLSPCFLTSSFYFHLPPYLLLLVAHG